MRESLRKDEHSSFFAIHKLMESRTTSNLTFVTLYRIQLSMERFNYGKVKMKISWYAKREMDTDLVVNTTYWPHATNIPIRIPSIYFILQELWGKESRWKFCNHLHKSIRELNFLPCYLGIWIFQGLLQDLLSTQESFLPNTSCTWLSKSHWGDNKIKISHKKIKKSKTNKFLLWQKTLPTLRYWQVKWEWKSKKKPIGT